MLGGSSSQPHYSILSVVAWRRGSRKGGGGELTEGDESSFNSPSHLLPPPPTKWIIDQIAYYSTLQGRAYY